MDPLHANSDVAAPAWLGLVREKIERLRFGVVQLVVHEGRVTQIECTEKTRLTSAHEGLSPSPGRERRE